jgi:hypothetical protein
LEQKVSTDPANSGIFAAGLENIGFLRPGSGYADGSVAPDDPPKTVFGPSTMGIFLYFRHTMKQ